MSNEKTLEELRGMVRANTVDQLKRLIGSDAKLGRQLIFSTPPRERIRRGDFERLQGARCILWGQDPVNGEWICLKWEE